MFSITFELELAQANLINKIERAAIRSILMIRMQALEAHHELTKMHNDAVVEIIYKENGDA